jgi:cytochrome P450 family 4
MGIKLTNIGNDGVIYRDNIYTIGKLLIHRSVRPWLYPKFIYSLLGYQEQLDNVLAPVHNFTRSIIEKRRRIFTEKTEEKQSDVSENENVYMGSQKKRHAMMDTLLHAQSRGLIDDDGIAEETDTFTFEGHDTTSAGMTFTLLLLAHHPEAQDKLFEEIQDVLDASTQSFTMDTFNKMTYMERVLKESMRIYPPVPFIAREFTEDFHHGNEVD